MMNVTILLLVVVVVVVVVVFLYVWRVIRVSNCFFVDVSWFELIFVFSSFWISSLPYFHFPPLPFIRLYFFPTTLPLFCFPTGELKILTLSLSYRSDTFTNRSMLSFWNFCFFKPTLIWTPLFLYSQSIFLSSLVLWWGSPTLLLVRLWSL